MRFFLPTLVFPFRNNGQIWGKDCIGLACFDPAISLLDEIADSLGTLAIIAYQINAIRANKGRKSSG
jgi:hypothetical protein